MGNVCLGGKGKGNGGVMKLVNKFCKCGGLCFYFGYSWKGFGYSWKGFGKGWGKGYGCKWRGFGLFKGLYWFNV